MEYNLFDDARRKRINNSSTISGASNHLGSHGFRSLVQSSTSTAPDTPAPSVLSFSKFMSYAKNFTPSIFTNAWSTTPTLPTTPQFVEKAAPNGSSLIHGQETANRHDERPQKHVLGLDAYVSNDEDEEEEESRYQRKRSFKLQLAPADSPASTSLFPFDKATKRSHPLFPDDSDGSRRMKRPKLAEEPMEINTRPISSLSSSRHISSRPRQRFWKSSMDPLNMPPPIYAAKAQTITIAETLVTSTYPIKASLITVADTPVTSTHTAKPASFTVADTPATSRSSSQASFREYEQPASTNLFSVPPRGSSIGFGGVSQSRTSSALSRSRPSSNASNSIYTQTAIDYRRLLGLNSETKRILKDMGRAAGTPFPATPNLNTSNNRNLLDGSAMGFVGERGSPRTTPIPAATPDNAQSLPRLATLGSNILQRPRRDQSRYSQNGWPNRMREKAAKIVPTNWIVSSAPVFRFTKPLPVDLSNDEDNEKVDFDQSVFRFGIHNSSTLVPVVQEDSNEASTSSTNTGTFGGKPLKKFWINGFYEEEEERKKIETNVMDEEEFQDENVDLSLVNASDNLASKSQLESTTEAEKFVDELNEDSVRFFTNQDDDDENVNDQIRQKRRRQKLLEEDLKYLLNDEDEMPNRWGSLDDLSAGLPAALIITNLPTSLFVVDEIRAEFESIFSAYDPEATFQYFRSFKRCRVNFTTSMKATLARLHCNELDFHGGLIRCFFAQIVEQRSEEEENYYLKLPELEKQFLISPPASPPVGWEQSREDEPIINFDLISRLTAIAGEAGPHVIHPRNESCPAIVVHTCDDDPEMGLKPKIPQTRRPDPIASN